MNAVFYLCCWGGHGLMDSVLKSALKSIKIELVYKKKVPERTFPKPQMSQNPRNAPAYT